MRLTPQAADELEQLPKSISGRVNQLLERLKRWPHVSGAKPLRGSLAGHYRLRTGDYRVQFYPVGEQVVVEKIGHRDGFYQE